MSGRQHDRKQNNSIKKDSLRRGQGMPVGSNKKNQRKAKQTLVVLGMKARQSKAAASRENVRKRYRDLQVERYHSTALPWLCHACGTVPSRNMNQILGMETNVTHDNSSYAFEFCHLFWYRDGGGARRDWCEGGGFEYAGVSWAMSETVYRAK
jgi:hypothetical protein